MAEEDECPHGMEDPSWCSICKHKGDIIVEIVEYSFDAKYEGFCEGCKELIEIGQPCVHLSTGKNVHRECF